MPSKIIFTNAPPEYDYSYVEVINAEYAKYTGNGGSHPMIRKVAIHGKDEKESMFRREYQGGRYASGLYSTLNQEGIDASVECGLMEILPEVEVPPPSPSGALCADCLSPASTDDIGTTCRQCGRGFIIGSGTEDHDG